MSPMGKKILIVAEYNIDQTLPLTLELAACAAEINDNFPAEIVIALPGKDVLTQADMLAEAAGMDVIILRSDHLENYSAEGYAAAVCELASQTRPELIIIAHSPRGYDYAPQIAVNLDAACITGVNGLEFAEGRILYLRQSYYGKMVTVLEARKFCTVLTVMPGAFRFTAKENRKKGIITMHQVSAKLVATLSVAARKSAATDTNLTDAETIIAAGKGMRKKENMQLLRDLAGFFPKAAIGGSRAACDQEWLEYGAQIGLTGKTVAPKLYIACGISGALQHIAGMKASQTIVAINHDPHAAIFGYADIGIVEDCEDFIREIVRLGCSDARRETGTPEERG